MKISAPYHSGLRALGFTMVELLVAMVIGLLLMAGVIQVFSSNQQTYRVTENLSRTQENGRYAIGIINKFARRAGNKGNHENLHDVSFPASGPFIADQVISGTDTEFSIRYITGDKTNMTDCIGNAIPPVTEVTNRFFLNLATNELRCSVNGALTQPLVSDIRDMQVLYGMSTDTTMLSGENNNVRANCYLPTTNLTNLPVADCASGLNFRQVVSMRVHLLISTPEDNVVSSQANQNYTYNSSPPTAAPDFRIYREFSTTIAFRNQVL